MLQKIIGATIALAALAAGVSLALTGHLAGQVVKSSGNNGVFTIVVSDIRWAVVLPLSTTLVFGIVMLLRSPPSS